MNYCCLLAASKRVQAINFPLNPRLKFLGAQPLRSDCDGGKKIWFSEILGDSRRFSPLVPDHYSEIKFVQSCFVKLNLSCLDEMFCWDFRRSWNLLWNLNDIKKMQKKNWISGFKKPQYALFNEKLQLIHSVKSSHSIWFEKSVIVKFGAI